MKNLVVCLGANPNDDGLVLPVLAERLNDSIRLCRENVNSTLLLMGGPSFRADPNKKFVDQSQMMRKYIEDQAPDVVENTTIILENIATSTVEQICALRDFVGRSEENLKIYIIASQFFVDRVRLYAEYIMERVEEVSFVASLVPEDEAEISKEVENGKLTQTREWLSKYKKGDYESILMGQKMFEERIIKGEVSLPISFKPR